LIRKISNEARDYAWGSSTLIPEYFGVPATGGPMAEVWFGTHEGCPTKVAGTDGSLLDLRKNEPLPFLLKILAADAPLSIQAHPNLDQAIAGFERENAAGIGLDSPERNYRDANHKPEMIVALTPFRALIGFRPVVDVAVALRRIGMRAQQLGLPQLEQAMSEYVQLFRMGGYRVLLRALLTRRGELDEVTSQLAVLAASGKSEENVESQNLALVPQLQRLYPGDPGILVSQLLNYVELAPLEAAELAAGNVHAYLSGLGVEIMANSDNVMRGGLTPKHIDTDELLRVIDFTAVGVELVAARELAEGVTEYPSETTDYRLRRIEPGQGSVQVDLTGAGILLCTAGSLTVSDAAGASVILKPGEAAYIDEAMVVCSAAAGGTGFLATA
jgi:mannose-6-phosphate isomerase